MTAVADEIVSAPKSILLGYSKNANGPVAIDLLLSRANRHGMVTGSTGTGKTKTLQAMAVRFAAAGVPVFVPDVKGDLAATSHVTPTLFWDLQGENGLDIKISVTDVGPVLFSRILELNDTQDGVITIMFAVAKERELPLETFADVREVLNIISGEGEAIARRYGRAAPSSIATIFRKLLHLEFSEADKFFGPTNFSIKDDLLVTYEGKGVVHILRSSKLINNPVLYSTFLFWLLQSLFDILPEIGNPRKPKLVFFFDEAHLLFSEANTSFIQAVERVVRLIRSKGVGVYFVTQSPKDIPDDILDQLGNCVQHALSGKTPRSQKGIRAAAESFCPNPAFNTEDTIKTLEVGEALVSVLDENGAITPVQRTRIGMVYVDTNLPSQSVNHLVRQPKVVYIAPPVAQVPMPNQATPTVANDPVDIPVVPPQTADEIIAEKATQPIEITRTPNWVKQQAKKRNWFWWWVVLILAPLLILFCCMGVNYLELSPEKLKELSLKEFIDLTLYKFS